MAIFLVVSAAVFDAPDVVAGVDDVAMVSDAIEQGHRQVGISEHSLSFAEDEVGRDDHRGLLVKLADQREQQLTARGRTAGRRARWTARRRAAELGGQRTEPTQVGFLPLGRSPGRRC